MNRAAEIALYRKAYTRPDYRMGNRRTTDVAAHLARCPVRGSLLDVGTGRGEALRMARAAGFDPVCGTEVVPELIRPGVHFAEAHALPYDDGEWDVVTCWDVLEHLIPEDVAPALAELARVSRRIVMASASTEPSVYDGRDLHISARPEAEWDALFRQVWGEGAERIGTAGRSPCWRLVKA
jgi:2-polyprenyl-3-methyl-5-hydroxy-6-metoxy-1,4-benzoquinol methylase